MSTSDKITVIFGITIDSLALLTVLVYMPLVNWYKRKQEKSMESYMPDDEWYECEM